jgi:dUTP pyrophosphatase
MSNEQDVIFGASFGIGKTNIQECYVVHRFLILPVNSDVGALYSPGYTAGNMDAGIDIVFPEDITIPPTDGAAFKISLGVKAVCLKCRNAYYIPYNFPFTYLLMGRSSISKTGLVMANSVGLIDIGYRGELKAPVYNFTKNPITIKKGTSLFQICTTSGDPVQGHLVLDPTNKYHHEIVAKYFGSADGSIKAPTVRGDGAFGSTGAAGSQSHISSVSDANCEEDLAI